MTVRNICLALPEDLYTSIKQISSSRSTTMTAYIRSAIAVKTQAELSGQRLCATGEPCILGYLPNLREHALTAKTILESRSPHKKV